MTTILTDEWKQQTPTTKKEKPDKNIFLYEKSKKAKNCFWPNR